MIKLERYDEISMAQNARRLGTVFAMLEGKMLSVFFFFGSFLKDSPKLVPVQAGSTRKSSFFLEIRVFLFVTSCVLLVFCFDFGSAFVVFPRKTSFFCRPRLFAAFYGPFSGANFGFWLVCWFLFWLVLYLPMFLDFLRSGFPKSCRKKHLKVCKTTRVMTFQAPTRLSKFTLPGVQSV